MSINFTGFDERVITLVNPAISVSFFTFLTLPNLLLNSLCILAMVLSRTINNKLKVVLINIFATDETLLLGVTVLFLSHPAQANDMDTTSYPCKFVFNAIFSGTVIKQPSILLYAIVVYLYVKYGRKKVKWYMVVLPIIVMWVLAFFFGLIPYTSFFNAFSNRGICDSDSNAFVSITIAVTITLSTVVFLGLTIVFGVLTVCFVKKNTLQDQNRSLLKAIMKLLLFLIVGSFLVIIPSMIPLIFSPIQRNLQGSAATEFQLALYYIRQAIYAVPFLLVPIITIVLLKPVRESLQKICCNSCTCKMCTDRRLSVNAVPSHNATQDSASVGGLLQPLTTLQLSEIDNVENTEPADQEWISDINSQLSDGLEPYPLPQLAFTST